MLHVQKSTVEEIRTRFDHDVERFSNLETAQSATIDAPLALELICQAAAAVTPGAAHVLDVGCGAGNYTLKLLQYLPGLDATLLDLSQPMLDRARERVGQATAGKVTTLQGDIRAVDLPEGGFDIILAAAVLHHLRGDEEWQAVFTQFYRCLRPGGALWISDLVAHDTPQVQELMWRRYGDYLTGLKGEEYRETVYEYVEREDTPRSLLFQVDLLHTVGFQRVEILHKNSVFAAFGGVRG